MRSLWFVLLLLCSTTVAAQSTAPSPSERNRQIVERSPGAKNAFTVEPDGKIRHLQSGALCPASFPNVSFAAAQVYPAAGIGLDVGCDYGRAGQDGFFISKLTIFFVKAPEGATLDSIFARYKNEIVTAHPDAKEAPSSLKITDNATKQTRTDYRSMGYVLSLGERPFQSELIVGIFNGWILKIRSTSPANATVREGSTQDDIRNMLFDLQSPYQAFLSATASLSKSNAR